MAQALIARCQKELLRKLQRTETNNTRIRRKVIQVECCLDRKCFICAGLNRKVIFAEEIEVIARQKRQKKKANYERGSSLSEEKRTLLLHLMSLYPQSKADIAILSNLCSRTVENAANGSKLFDGTKRALENGIDLMVEYVRETEDLWIETADVSANNSGKKQKTTSPQERKIGKSSRKT